MKTSANGRKLIEAFEGLFLKAYQDSVGVWTIGYGHTTAAGGMPVHPGLVISREMADTLLAEDLSRVEADVLKFIRVPLTQSEFDALVSFHFNTGKLGSGSIASEINAGNRQGAMATLLQYNHAGGAVLRGLTRRRQAEKLLFEGKVDEALRLAGTKAIPAEHGTAGAVIVGGAVAATQAPSHLIPWIIAGTVVAAVVVFITVKYFKRKQNESSNSSN